MGIAILTYIGIKLLKTKSININNSENLEIKRKIKSRYSFFYGIIIYISTPTLFAFWFGAISFLNNNDLIYNSNSFDKLFLMIGVFIGTSGWFFILLSGIRLASSKLNLKYFIYFIKLIGCLLIGVAFYFLIRLCLTNL